MMKRSNAEYEKALERLRMLKKTRYTDQIDFLPDDLLHEILIRLPNLRSSFRCSAVCKRWSSITSRPDFIASFTHHYRSNTPPLTLVFGDRFIHGNPIRITTLPQSSSSPAVSADIVGLLDWLNNNNHRFMSDVALLATCHNLFLVRAFGFYYVCNPFTGQRFMLPPPPKLKTFEAQSQAQSPLRLARCGLVSKPNNITNNKKNKNKYRVMLLFQPENMNGNTTFITVYCSESREWTQLWNHNLLLSSVNCDVVASNGNLYWLGSKEIFALQPSYDDGNYRISTYGVRWGDEGGKVKSRLGLFQGWPRLSRWFRLDSQHLGLMIWDMKEDILSLHSVCIVRIEGLDHISVSVLAFHPSHATRIFLLRNRSIYQYDTENDEQIKVAEIHCDYDGNMPDIGLFLMQPPVWPSLI